MRYFVKFFASIIFLNLIVAGFVSAGASAGSGPEEQFLTVMAGTGTITGIVFDEKSGNPLQFANVVITGTKIGAITGKDGTFLIEDVPVGVYKVKVMMLGYGVVETGGVKVKAGKTTKLEFKIKAQIVGQTQEILVEAEVKQIEVKDSDVSYKVKREEFENLPVDDRVKAIALKGGIVKTGDDLHVRGGRANEQVCSSPCAIAPPVQHCIPPRHHNTEEYAHIEENRFHDPVTSPLSTFSIDVDAASYANVRRFIMGGSFPYRDAIRVEEMINYFDYDYDRPDGDVPFSINLEYSTCPWNEDHHLAHIGLQGKDLAVEERAASNIVFLIDVSGSMSSHNKLPLLKDAFKLLVGQLGDEDQVSIVVYAGRAGLVLPPTCGFNKRKIKDAIERLHSGGSTAGGEGIRLAYKVAAENFIEGGNNRVILATDGDFNVGISSTSELVEYIEGKRDEGIFLTVLGFGMGNYKDNRLEQLADKGNGNHAYIDNIMEAKKVFVNEVTATLYTIAKDVKIQVEFNPDKVASYRLIGYENRMLAAEDFKDDRKDAGEIGAGHTVTALYEIVPAGGEGGDVDELRYQARKASRRGRNSDEVMLVKIRYKDPDGDKSREIRKVIKDRPRSFSRATDDFRFSASVAMFGMILRKSEHIGGADIDSVLEIAREAKGKDRFQYRAEFITIAERAQTMIELGARNEAMNR